MIDEIQVRNVALIREGSIAPCAGLTAITGETGAGKTALLSAMKLLMGARASADMVREGEGELVVSGRFFGLARAGEDEGDNAADDELARDAGAAAAPEGSAHVDAASAASADADPNTETVVTRRVGADGRSRANVNGSMASMRELAALVAPSIDLCGQFEHQQLMKPATHVGMLDAWAAAEVAPMREAYERAFASATQAQRELERVREAAQASSAQVEDARFALRRIDEVDPRPGEYEELSRDLERAEHAESLARAVGTAREALSGDGGALDSLSAAASALESVGRVDPDLAEWAQSLRETGYVLEDAAAFTRDYFDGIEFDPAVLAEQQDRFSQLQGLIRSFGPTIDDVLERREAAAETVSLVDDSAARMREAQEALDQAEDALAQAADELDAVRAAAAPRFAAEVSAVMAHLEMGSAELVCASERLERARWTKAGPSSFEFLYRPSAEMQARPLARIASGGEVSRVMLASKVVLGATDNVDTLVFDEVDAGVGGATAVALAEVIAQLAQTHQVIVVTHLASVAARADAQYLVQRDGSETVLAPVEGEAREREIARMLSGDVTDASLAHARELLGRAAKGA